MSITGSVANIVERVKRLIPKGWFSYVAPYRDAILGGTSDLGAWSYNLITYARAQSRLSTAYGIWLDILAYDFLRRYLIRAGASDNVFRAMIRATILQERVTRAGMENALTTLTGFAPRVFEPWNTYDTGAYSSSIALGGDGIKYGSMGYGVGRGGYGNMALPAQAFIKITRGAPSGVPFVGGWGNNVEGWGAGQTEYVGSLIGQTGITNEQINSVVNITKPTGTLMWIAIGATDPPVRPPAIFNAPTAKANSQNVAAI